MSPEDKETEMNEAEILDRKEEPNTAVNNEQNVMKSDTIKITLMIISQVKELETSSDDRKDVGITNHNIDAVTMKFYAMTTANNEDRFYTKEDSTIEI